MLVGGHGDGATACRQKLAKAVRTIVEAFSEGAQSQAECSGGEGQGPAIFFGESGRCKLMRIANQGAGKRLGDGLRIDLVSGSAKGLRWAAGSGGGRCVDLIGHQHLGQPDGSENIAAEFVGTRDAQGSIDGLEELVLQTSTRIPSELMYSTPAKFRRM